MKLKEKAGGKLVDKVLGVVAKRSRWAWEGWISIRAIEFGLYGYYLDTNEKQKPWRGHARTRSRNEMERIATHGSSRMPPRRKAKAG